jgi:hypothetical protein
MALTQIKASNITDGTIVAAEIADDGITTAKLIDGAVTAVKIDSAVELGGPSLGNSSIIRTNANTISENVTFLSNTNGISAGPVTIGTGNTVIISTDTTWTIL